MVEFLFSSCFFNNAYKWPSVKSYLPPCIMVLCYTRFEHCIYSTRIFDNLSARLIYYTIKPWLLCEYLSFPYLMQYMFILCLCVCSSLFSNGPLNSQPKFLFQIFKVCFISSSTGAVRYRNQSRLF